MALRIKQNVDLKELEDYIKIHKYKDFGIWKCYSSTTGELQHIYIGKKWRTGHSSIIDYDVNDKIINISTQSNLDILYDLIKADMVVKVNEQ